MSELSDLRDTGIWVPDYGVAIPWECTLPQLYRSIPRQRFETCAHGDTLLTFALLGHRATYWFNVLDGSLKEVQLYRWTRNWRTITRGYRHSAAALRSSLGAGNVFDFADGQLWRCSGLTVENNAGPGRRRALGARGYRHLLSVNIFRRNDSQ